MTTPPIAHPPATLEGWFALHQIFRQTRSSQRAPDLARISKAAISALTNPGRVSSSRSKRKTASATLIGWSCVVKLVGSTADLMVIHSRESLDGIEAAQDLLAR